MPDFRHWAGLVLASALLMGCVPGGAQSGDPVPVRPAFLSGDTAMAMSILRSMDMRERVAQLMMVQLYCKPGEPGSLNDVRAVIEEFGVGGVIAMQGDTATTRHHLALLDSVARAGQGVPLLTAMDAEWGSGMRLPDGIRFPKAMAMGATDDPSLVREAGRRAGMELKALGIGIDFAPVADVNSNPANPVIGNRSFGSDPLQVGRLATAWAEGLRDAGVMAVGKHFPGHGDADLDSHLALPRILSDSAHMDSVELKPFRTLIDRGVEGMMTAHLDVPTLDSITGLPTSLSPKVIRDLLVDSMGFEGLIFTDALTMAGAADLVPPGTREVAALNAGNDILLFPSSPGLVLDSIEAALARGALDTARVDEACLKVLLAKQWLDDPPVQPDLGTRSTADIQQALRGRMLVRLGGTMTLTPGRRTALVIVGNRGDALQERLEMSIEDPVVVRHGKGTLDRGARDGILDRVQGCRQVILAFLDESNRPARRFGLPEGASELVADLARQDVDLGVTLFTSPYALDHLVRPEGVHWMLAHHEDDLTQSAAISAWCGEGDALGRLPVDAGDWSAGAGMPALRHRLPRARPDSAMVRMSARLDSLARAAVALESTPGMRILVVVKDSIRHDGSHGTLGDPASTPVQRHHLYDLASITKVASSTVLAMMSVERGLFGLDAPLSDLLPHRDDAPLDPTLGRRTLRDLLAHRSGLPAWIPFYVDLVAHADTTEGVLYRSREMPGFVSLCQGTCMHPDWCDSIRATVRGLEPRDPGEYRYSDIGYYLLQDVLEHAWGLPLDRLADSLVFRPLGLDRMGYRPLGWADLEDIAPTERDTLFRKAWIRGSVHDPGAAMMGGVAGHAGLFSDAHDLAVLMEAMRMGGQWQGTRLVSESTLALFTNRAFEGEDNRRGLGWDKPGLEPDSGASGNAGSWSSFGHSGFTGTLAWTDPERGWTVVILGNRICPDADNRTYIDEDIRTKALAIVEDALGVDPRFPSASDEPAPRE